MLGGFCAPNSSVVLKTGTMEFDCDLSKNPDWIKNLSLDLFSFQRREKSKWCEGEEFWIGAHCKIHKLEIKDK